MIAGTKCLTSSPVPIQTSTFHISKYYFTKMLINYGIDMVCKTLFQFIPSHERVKIKRNVIHGQRPDIEDRYIQQRK